MTVMPDNKDCLPTRPSLAGSSSPLRGAPRFDTPGSALTAALFTAMLCCVAPAHGQSGFTGKVVVDAWFSSQQRMNKAGQMESFHYKWNDVSDSGFYLFGQIFHGFGITTDTLYSAPTLANLKGTQFYIIVSPDIPVKNPHPHYVQMEDARQVAAWVKQGGVLILMANDPANGEIEHFDLLADMFGLHFNPVLSHHVAGSDHELGRIPVAGHGPLFQYPHTLYMKDTCTLSLKSPAASLLQDRGDILMATAKYGEGTVFAVTDPWIYNEYTDGRNLPPEYDNLAGAVELVKWLLKQVPH